jgi:5-methylcytosine-specific restriction endonuclease McrA
MISLISDSVTILCDELRITNDAISGQLTVVAGHRRLLSTEQTFALETELERQWANTVSESRANLPRLEIECKETVARTRESYGFRAGVWINSLNVVTTGPYLAHKYRIIAEFNDRKKQLHLKISECRDLALALIVKRTRAYTGALALVNARRPDARHYALFRQCVWASAHRLSLAEWEALATQYLERHQAKLRMATNRQVLPERRIPIPSDVRVAVWRRDNGCCVKCGSRERLEYDHIIPVADGGGNTERNVELLCESCNRTKGRSL